MKKALSLFLSVLMLTSVVAAVDLSAYAATTDSGSCGENLVWEYNGGILTISGEGKMYDYEEFYRNNITPWFDYKDEIYKVNIEEGITSIGDYAFYYCYNLRDIVIPDGVKRIGEYAFYITCLRKIVLPETITKIGYNAFGGCNLLKTVYYEGAEEDWYNIQICQKKDGTSGYASDKSNEYLITASIKYNYQAEKNSNTATEDESEDGSESIVAIAVIVIAVALVLLLMLATAVIVFVLTRRHYKKHN